MKPHPLIALIALGVVSLQAQSPSSGDSGRQPAFKAHAPPSGNSLPLADIAAKPDAAEKPAAAVFKGTLHTGMVAIGGETTGTVLKTQANGNFELDLQHRADLQKLAETLNGKNVVIKGEYKPRAGVEVKLRRIIIVTSIAQP